MAVIRLCVAFTAILSAVFIHAQGEAAIGVPGARGIELGTASDVTFSEPIEGVSEAVDGYSIEQLIDAAPHFAPVEGLPEIAWKDKNCSSCHEWNRERLCDQGNFYGKQGFEAVDRKEHPFGGGFKETIKGWAANGCK